MMAPEQLRGLAAHVRSIRGFVQYAEKLRLRGETIDLETLFYDIEYHAVAMLDEFGEHASS